jgi:uncharacterized Fe-S cluster-containing radical SAM superfamily enzyme
MKFNLNKLAEQGFRVHQDSTGNIEINIDGRGNPEFWSKLEALVSELDLTQRQSERLSESLYSPIESFVICEALKGDLI